MKKSFFVSALSLIIFIALTFSMEAQKIAIWEGGTPGRADEWNWAANWKDGTVPNEFSDVIIPDCSTKNNPYPVIRSTVDGINSLFLESNVNLLIEESGHLEVYADVEQTGNSLIDNKGIFIINYGLDVKTIACISVSDEY